MEAAGCAEPCKRIDRDLRFSICMIVVGMSLLTAGSLMVILGHVLSAQLDSENANSLAIAGPVSLTISGGFVLPGLCLYFVRKRKSARRLRRIPRSGTELVDLVFSSYPSLSDISPSRNYAPPPSYQEVMQMGLSVYPLSNNRVPSISVLDCTALDIRSDLPDSHAAGHRSPHEGAADSHAAGHRSPHEGAADGHAAGFQETSLTEQEPPPKYEDVILT
ncbi:PREDICTED: uncharacterized protein LOC109464967 [Branchiostoma belcheri]|uniref:Uncharacterized protein LOC109464967 n=1 Tax=Branchiostoma belcheri TaxID=7741 RepID=A0A6P4Y5I6_BRABE|nr:PREDICTED: uncharacterized protein LOC109464967 [Branchiostoma belcheri]